MAKKGTGLLMVWADVPADKEEEFNRWYNEEHLPERMAIPGFLGGARYEAVKGGPKHLAVYELESAAVMESPAYKKVQANPTPWTKQIRSPGHRHPFIRNIYTMIHPQAITSSIVDGPDGAVAPDRAAWTCRPRSMPSSTSGTTRSTCRTTRRCPA